jgi:hypothetical protein
MTAAADSPARRSTRDRVDGVRFEPSAPDVTVDATGIGVEGDMFIKLGVAVFELFRGVVAFIGAAFILVAALALVALVLPTANLERHMNVPG